MADITEMNTSAADAERAQARQRLSALEGELEEASPESLDFDFWNRILETVESLPPAEEIAWKQEHLIELRIAVRSRTDELEDEERS